MPPLCSNRISDSYDLTNWPNGCCCWPVLLRLCSRARAADMTLALERHASPLDAAEPAPVDRVGVDETVEAREDKLELLRDVLVLVARDELVDSSIDTSVDWL